MSDFMFKLIFNIGYIAIYVVISVFLESLGLESYPAWAFYGAVMLRSYQATGEIIEYFLNRRKKKLLDENRTNSSSQDEDMKHPVDVDWDRS
jgi:hypothetical protein